jgi:hypothetical protein
VRARLARFVGLATNIQASERVLEDARGLVGSARRAAVTACFQKLEFKLEYFKGAAIIESHGDLAGRMAVCVTDGSGSHHFLL